MSLHTLQFSGEAIPIPVNYQIETAKIIRDRGADPGAVSVSEPQMTLGATAFSPKRWYVCLRGVPGPDTAQQVLKPVDELAQEWTGQTSGTYNVLLFFSDAATPSTREGYDSPLCKDLDYRAMMD